MKYIGLTQGRFAVVDDEDFEYLSQWKWHLSGRAVARTVMRGKECRKMLLHRQLLQAPSGFDVDHINRNPLDNRRENLRLVPHRINMLNRGLPSHNKTGYRGVYHQPNGVSWKASITHNGRTKHLGVFGSKIEAAKAYNDAAVALFGEYAQLNII